MYKNIIFDLDGTILDTLSSITDAVNETLKIFKKNYFYSCDEIKKFIGHGNKFLIKKAFKIVDDNFDLTKIMQVYSLLQLNISLKKTKIFPGLYDVLKKIKKKYKIYIATNKQYDTTLKIIKNFFNIDFFNDIIAQTEKTLKKPDPDIINQIIERNNLKKNECLYVGDSEIDLLTAKNANIDFCLVKYGYGQYGNFDESFSKFIIFEPQELLNILIINNDKN